MSNQLSRAPEQIVKFVYAVIGATIHLSEDSSSTLCWKVKL